MTNSNMHSSKNQRKRLATRWSKPEMHESQSRVMSSVMAQRWQDPEYRRKMCEIARARGNNGVKGGRKNKGRALSIETRAKMSASHKLHWQSMSKKDKDKWVAQLHSYDKAPTSIELRVHKQLANRGINFKIDQWFWIGEGENRRAMNPDIYLPDMDAFIEVDGCYWHGCAKCYGLGALKTRYKTDREKDVLVEESGRILVRIWEHEIKAGVFFAVKRALVKIEMFEQVPV